MREQAKINKIAWEHRAYEAWNKRSGGLDEEVADIIANPSVRHFHEKYFLDIKGKKIANPCGSNGRKAVPLALMGAEVTVFDISEENKKYALELADKANVNIEYIIGDFCEMELDKYSNLFDMVYAESGILHYFSEIDKFTKALFSITKIGGKLILSDFHPYRKINGLKQTDGDYFNTNTHKADVAYHGFFTEEEQKAFPKCLLRYYNLSEIINSVINAGFTKKNF